MQGTQLCGIIYLYRISDNHLGGIAVENIAMFRKICGKTAMSNVVIATTTWGEPDTAQDRRRREVLREQELRSNSKFFKAVLDEEAWYLRLNGDRPSAMEAINFLINKDPVVLEMQKELVEGRKTLRQTAVGKKQYGNLMEKAGRFSQKLKQMQDQLRKAQTSQTNSLLRTEATWRKVLETSRRGSFERMWK